MNFSELIKRERAISFENAKDFHAQSGLSCAYSHYSLIEKGKAVPKIELAVEILSKLKIDERKGLYAWVRSSMPDEKTRSYFPDIEESPTVAETFSSNEISMILNRGQGNLLREDPVNWELILFINCTPNVSKQAIAKEFNLSLGVITDRLNKLYDNGLIEVDKAGNYFSINKIYLPQKNEFHDVRDMNFKRSLDQFMRQTGNEKYRSTVTIKLTDDQAREVRRKALEFGIWLMNIEKDLTDSRIFTFGVFLSERKFGEKR